MSLSAEPDLNVKVDFQKFMDGNGPSREPNLKIISIISGIILTIVGISLLSFYSPLKLLAQSSQQYIILALSFILAATLSFLTSFRNLLGKFEIRIIFLSLSVQICLIIFSALVSGVGLPVALIIFLFTNIVTFSTLPRAKTDYAVNGWILMGIAAILVNYFSPFRQIEIPILSLYLPAFLGILCMIYIALMVMEFSSITLRMQITSAFVVVTLIPLILISFIQTTYSRWSLQQENIQSIKLAAVQSANAFDEFINKNLDQINQQASLFYFGQYLQSPPSERSTSIPEIIMISNLTSLQNSHTNDFFDSYGVLDHNGENVFDTKSSNIGQNEKNFAYYTEPFSNGKPYVSPIYFGSDNVPYIIFSSPIRGDRDQVVGVLRARYDATILQQLAENQSTLLGPNSSTLLLDENNFRLADTTNSTVVYKPIQQISAETQQLLSRDSRLPINFVNFPGEQIFLPEIASAIPHYSDNPIYTISGTSFEPISTTGYVVKLQNTPWYLVSQQQQKALTETLANQTRIAVIIATLIAGLISIIAGLLARFLSQPITQLTLTAEKVTNGDLSAVADVETNVEIGILSQAFNLMTTQVRSLISELEERVQVRTNELAQQNNHLQIRTQQLETVSEVARGIASTRELEILLSEVTRLISQRFGFYHVGIFLSDRDSGYAYLRAANSEGGLRMLARQHKLKIGTTGIVGFVTGNGVARIATEVGTDSAYFNNPDLPYTRSEMALPLISGDEIIGALDVQSIDENAFSEEDVKLFTILSDQLTIAIVNNRLYSETKHALAEIQGLHQKYLRGEWLQEASRQKYTSYRFTSKGVEAQPAVILPEITEALQDNKPVIRSNQSNDQEAGSITFPVVLRGEPIGVIHIVDKSSQSRVWSQDDIGTVNSVADQVAQALENARLFEQSQRRAERERKVLEITSKIRSTTDLDLMLKIAVEELQNAFGATRAQVILQNEANITRSDNKNGNGHK